MQLLLRILIPAIFLVAIGGIVFSLRRPAESTAGCALGSCPTELRVSDNGKTFTYGAGVPFSVVLSESDYPPAELQCKPEGILEVAAAGAAAPAGSYRATFQGAVGTCYLTDKNFGVHIVISDAR